MKILFIQPAVGHKGDGAEYPKTWIMEPLALAVLSALTPPRIERMFMDDRLGEVDFSAEADVVAMPVECYTAARSYEIAACFRAKGAKVILGGFHVKLCQDEAAAHADSIILGDAETTWPQVVEDLEAGALKPSYVGCGGVSDVALPCDAAEAEETGDFGGNGDCGERRDAVAALPEQDLL